MLKLLKILIKSSYYGDGYTATIIDLGVVAHGNTEDETLERAMSNISESLNFNVVDINVANSGVVYTVQY
jgi:predicted RNase H-like HicB family nuclease